MGSSVCYSGNCECFENVNFIIAIGKEYGGEERHTLMVNLDGDVREEKRKCRDFEFR
jgi:hypothetical protein